MKDNDSVLMVFQVLESGSSVTVWYKHESEKVGQDENEDEN